MAFFKHEIYAIATLALVIAKMLEITAALQYSSSTLHLSAFVIHVCNLYCFCNTITPKKARAWTTAEADTPSLWPKCATNCKTGAFHCSLVKWLTLLRRQKREPSTAHW